VSRVADVGAETRKEADAGAGPGSDEFLSRLKDFEGQPSGPPSTAPDPVNQAMIRHWVEAMGDENPVYVDAEAARANGFNGVVAPPTMLQAWIMGGYRATALRDVARSEAATTGKTATVLDGLFALLDKAGFTSVVATNCEQRYRRPLELGDLLTVKSVIESVSPEKATGLGDGHFVTTRLDFTDQNDELVATMKFRILRFRPRSAVPTSPDDGATTKALSTSPEAPRRPRPAITHDNAFFFDGAREGKLLIQRCSACSRLRHPPRPSCPHCHSFEWDTVESSGRGKVYSFVVVHHPQVPGFDYPLAIAVVELEEGTRLVADLVQVDPSDVKVGMPVACEMVAVDEELTLPMFGPV